MSFDPYGGHPPDPSTLLGFWYPAAQGAAVRRGTLRRVMLLGVPLVIGRDARGAPFALLDQCPHRGMPLSCGRLDGDVLECCYHGWKFDAATGRCREIPSLTSRSRLTVERVSASRFLCCEEDGYVWTYMPDPQGGDEPPPVPRLPVFGPRHRSTRLAVEFPADVDRGVIGLVDPAHGRFVHNAWWWRRGVLEKEKVFEPIPNGFRVRAERSAAHRGPYKLLGMLGRTVTTTIEFVLPNVRFEHIRSGPYWFSSRVTVTPLQPGRCRMDFCGASNLFGRAPLVVPLFRVFARRFLSQDRRTMEKLALGGGSDGPLMVVGDADRPAQWYLELKAEYREAVRKQRPMQHPLPGAVTLRWRA